MKLNALTNALPIVAAAYGRKFGVNVQVGGRLACTDGQTINIPELVDDPIAKTLAWGYLAHEAAHIRHTDFDVWRSMAIQESPLTVAITNILEDVRIENAIMHPYPGTRTSLDAVMEWLAGSNGVAAPIETDPPAEVLINGLLVLARHHYRRQACLAQLAQEAERVMRAVFPSRCVHRLLGLMAEIPAVQSTADAAALARRMVALLEEESSEPPERASLPSSSPAPDASGHDKDEDDDRDGDDRVADNEAGGAKSPGTGGQGSSEEGTPRDGSQTPMSGEDGVADQDQEDPPGAGRGSDADAQGGRAALRAALAAGSDDFQDPFETVAAELSRQCEQTGRKVLLPLLEQYQGKRNLGMLAMRRVKAESAKLSSRLQGLLQAKTMTQVRTVRQGRALSQAHLHRAAVGDARIFRVKHQRPAPNAAIHLLVDLSGSMVGGQDATALDAALALALALEPMHGVTCAVTAFPSLRGEDRVVTRILSHGDRVTARAGAFVQWARGGTPMTGALWFAAADLLARREARKVILTLTDGEPDDFQKARALIGRATAAGLEMIGIGIGVRVDHLFPIAVSVEAVGGLRKALFGVAEQLLIN